MKRLQKYSALLMAIRASDPKTRVGILRSAPDEFIKTLLEIIVNFLAGNVVRPSSSSSSLKPLHVRRLTRYKSLLRRLGAQRSVKKTRKVLVQQKGGFLPFLIAPLILAGTAAAVAPAIARKVSANAAEGAVDAALNKVEDRVTGYINKL